MPVASGPAGHLLARASLAWSWWSAWGASEPGCSTAAAGAWAPWGCQWAEPLPGRPGRLWTAARLPVSRPARPRQLTSRYPSHNLAGTGLLQTQACNVRRRVLRLFKLKGHGCQWGLLLTFRVRVSGYTRYTQHFRLVFTTVWLLSLAFYPSLETARAVLSSPRDGYCPGRCKEYPPLLTYHDTAGPLRLIKLMGWGQLQS